MGKLLYYLPPLAPDYSGTASVFHDLSALTVIHDASGCTGTYTGYDEPRWFGSSSQVFCSGLRDMDAVMGDDEKLLAKISAALKDTDASCVAVIGSPVPMVIGFDFTGFATAVENRTGRPCLAFPTTGLAYYDAGQKTAYLRLAEKFLSIFKKPERTEILSNRVNILGASVLDGFDDAKLDSLIALLEDAGLHAGAVWGMRSSLEELRETPKAGANWVVTAAALPLARYLRERFGTPFIAGLPLGEQERGRILSGLNAVCPGDEISAFLAMPPARELSADAVPRTLLIGEGLFCASLRANLEQNDSSSVQIASFFPEAKAVFTNRDTIFTSEADLASALQNPELEEVIGDPLFREFLPADSSVRFTAIPHRAVSGRLYA
ncbi:MAG: hypothetical protein LBG90_08420 [Spirochaetaceae bacterium]|jgi:hypothetical protein|nr:hypothetical protein [Spirochaetaceae bacterium]